MANEALFVDENEAALTGAATGALSGAVLGPGGAVIGGAIGAGLGFFGAQSQNDATKAAQKRKEEATFKASLLKNAAKTQSANLRQTGRNLEASKPSGSSTPSQTGALGAGLSSAGTF